MKTRLGTAFVVFLSLLSSRPLLAGGPGTSGGLTLLEAPGARPAALGEAYSAVTDDIAAFAYNPSMLRSLKSGQASFLYQKGLVDDSYSQLMIGSPWRRMGVGLSVGRYDGGNFHLSDGVTERDVKAEQDLVVALGAAKTMGPLSVGLTAKYLSSTLVEQAKATAYAADFGLSFTVNPRFNIGGALQNLGTSLKFQDTGDPLPRIMRLGASYTLLPRTGTLLLFDVEHLFNENENRPALGLETRVGPLALRAGYRHSRDTGEFSVGTGFSWSRSALDYSFGLTSGAQTLNSEHRITYSFRFGGPGGGNQLFVRKPTRPNEPGQLDYSSAANRRNMHPPMALAAPASYGQRYASSHVASAASTSMSAPRHRIYVVKPGDNLASIAREIYGDHRMWRTIYMANRHLLSSPTDIEPGQKIALP